MRSVKNSKIEYQSSSFEVRYAKGWTRKSWAIRKQTKYKCVLCDAKATCVHHAVYRWLNGRPVAGFENGGEECFPLCEFHHSKESIECAHYFMNWIWDNSDPLTNNRNQPEYYALLVICWEISTSQRIGDKREWVELYKRDRAAVLTEFLRKFNPLA